MSRAPSERCCGCPTLRTAAWCAAARRASKTSGSQSEGRSQRKSHIRYHYPVVQWETLGVGSATPEVRVRLGLIRGGSDVRAPEGVGDRDRTTRPAGPHGHASSLRSEIPHAASNSPNPTLGARLTSYEPGRNPGHACCVCDHRDQRRSAPGDRHSRRTFAGKLLFIFALGGQLGLILLIYGRQGESTEFVSRAAADAQRSGAGDRKPKTRGTAALRRGVQPGRDRCQRSDGRGPARCLSRLHALWLTTWMKS
jgi:hypothetical protein